MQGQKIWVIPLPDDYEDVITEEDKAEDDDEDLAITPRTTQHNHKEPAQYTYVGVSHMAWYLHLYQCKAKDGCSERLIYWCNRFVEGEQATCRCTV